MDPRLAQARALLQHLLASDNTLPVEHIRTTAFDQGIYWPTMCRAKRSLGIFHYHGDGQWYWTLSIAIYEDNMKSQITHAKIVLTKILTDRGGRALTSVIQEAAASACIAWRTLRRAKDALNVEANFDAKNKVWYWVLPEPESPAAEAAKAKAKKKGGKKGKKNAPRDEEVVHHDDIKPVLPAPISSKTAEETIADQQRWIDSMGQTLTADDDDSGTTH